ncbi:MAG: hypothetical protein J0G37_04905 [Afipia sp.]|nr:hypothetical protein [Afipia sp.]
MSSEVRSGPFDIYANSLLAATFSHPDEVLSSSVLSTAEKRCVLAAWASDAFSVRNNPWLRQLPGAPEAIPLKDILRALRSLDDDDDEGPPPFTGGMGQRQQRPPDQVTALAS